MEDRYKSQENTSASRYLSANKYQSASHKEPSTEELSKFASDDQANISKKHRDDVIQLAVGLPDGTLFKTMISISKIRVASDIIKLVCDKVQLAPMDEYELVELLHNDTEKSIPPSEAVGSITRRIKDSQIKLAIRKKNRALGQRKISFLAASRANNTKIPSQSTTAVNTGSNGSKTDLGTSTSSTDVISPPPQMASRTRRMSIQEGLSALLGLGSKQEQPVSPEPQAVAEPIPIFSLESTERRILHMQIPEFVSKLFVGVDGHGLTFNRLAERSRFLSWSRSSAAAKADISTKVFGVQLSTVMENEFLKDQTRKIPRFFHQCLDYLEETSLHIPGIFRISGTTKRIKSLKDDVDAGKDLTFNDVKPHDVTGLLKMFFREMPEPLLTFKLYEFFISAAKNLPNDKLDECIRLLVLLLPICNLHLLEAFLKLLDKIAKNSGPPLPLTPFMASKTDDTEEIQSPNPAKTVEPPSTTIVAPGIALNSTALLPREMEDGEIMGDSDSIETKVESVFHSTEALAQPSQPSPATEVLTQSEGNLMTPLNLAIVIAPNILRTKDTKASVDKTLTDNDFVTKVFVRMLLMQDSLFSVPAALLNEVRQKMQQ